jgi:hypothetical protein
MIKPKLLIAFIIGIIFSFPVAAKLYKWVDDNGTTHYGETVPPEYANKDRLQLNQSGRVVKSEEVMTPERRHAKELEDAKKRDEEKVVLERQRHDGTLINTYNSVKEIDQARVRSLQQVDARLNVINSYIKMANDNLLALQKEADGYTNTNSRFFAGRLAGSSSTFDQTATRFGKAQGGKSRNGSALRCRQGALHGIDREKITRDVAIHSIKGYGFITAVQTLPG